MDQHAPRSTGPVADEKRVVMGSPAPTGPRSQPGSKPTPKPKAKPKPKPKPKQSPPSRKP